jgi:hypothetical protein
LSPLAGRMPRKRMVALTLEPVPVACGIMVRA